MIKSAYLDTSVFGGYFDKEFSKPTVNFFDRIINEKIGLIVSEVLTAELHNAPEHVRNLLNSIPVSQIHLIDVNSETEQLAKNYISENVVGKTSYADCLHIALATLSHADILVSWNFKHIVNVDRIRGYNSVNLKLGYKMIEIYSPLELGTYE
ncbi:MAG: putative nucleic acid-binding protein [Cyclobacteriaceae bacterium]|jgi:predicted nucleic acid-binding protein